MIFINPCIQSAYCWSVPISANGSAWQENVASGLQYDLHAAQPLPFSQASKNCMAMVAMDDIRSPPLVHTRPGAGWNSSARVVTACSASARSGASLVSP